MRVKKVDRGVNLYFTNYTGQTHRTRKERAFLRDKIKRVKRYHKPLGGKRWQRT
jgi:hypothetical protein